MEGSGSGWCSCCSEALGCWLRLKLTPEELDQRYRSREIDRVLERDRQTLRRQVKLLLLGAGESGKSTFLKQMRIIHKVKFEAELMREYQSTIYQNIVKGIQVLVDARDKLAIPWENPRNLDIGQQALRFVSVVGPGDAPRLDRQLFMHYAPHIHSLWQDRAIKRAYDRRREFQLSDSVSYFLDELERIARADYVPSHQDILQCRKATKGISEFTININNVPFVFVDVGGQRTQRQKWTQCFDSVTSILFLVSSSEFDQVLSEDRHVLPCDMWWSVLCCNLPEFLQHNTDCSACSDCRDSAKTNRLEEARNIFDTIVNNVSFRNISIILFLNKSDLLAKKIASTGTDIRWYYPQYVGDPHSLPHVQAFILNMFASVRREPKTTLYHHFTTAIDTHNITVVFNSVKDTILNRNLESLMLQ